jgi:SAM-dependent methyltransferase
VVERGSAERIPYVAGVFDYVTCLGALEHFGDMDAALDEMKRVAKPSARFCFLVPNSWFLGRLLMRGHGTEQREIVERMMSLGCWKQLLTDHGFEILRVRADHWPICKVGWLYRIIWSCLPMLFDYTFSFVLRVP